MFKEPESRWCHLTTARRNRIVIRRLKESDLQDMLKVWKEAGLSYRPNGRDKLSSLKVQRKTMPDLFIGAFVGRRMVGVVLGSDDTRKGWLNRIAVIPEEQGRGIARTLIEASEDALRKRGRRMFCVHIEKENEESMDLFEKQGYKREHDIFYYTKRERKDY